MRNNRQPCLNFRKSTTIRIASKIGESSEKNLTSQSSPFFRGENHCREIIAEWIEKDLQDAMKIMPPHTPNRKQQPLSDTEIPLSLVSFPKPN